MQLKHRKGASITVSTGVTLDYVEQGNAPETPVVFLHGYTDSRRSFDRLLPHLPDSLRAFALSQRGHGDSSRPREGYATADFARDVAAFMDALNLESAVIVGHSMGAHNAIRFAIDYPRRTRGLVLIGGFAQPAQNAGVQDLWTSVVATLTDPIDPAFVREFQESTVAQSVPAEFMNTVVQESLKVPARVWQEALKGFMKADLWAGMQTIAAPTLAIWGERDVFVPRAEQDALSAAVSDSRLLLYPNAGHGVHWEQPERVGADLTRFVDILERPRAAPVGSLTASGRTSRPGRS